MTDVFIKAQRSAGEADLSFYPLPEPENAQDELHDEIVGSVDGVSVKNGIEDFVVAIRERDFDDVVSRLAEAYRSRGYKVSVTTTA